MITQTSKEIIEGLLKNGVILKPTDKELIIKKVYDALASKEESNGCDCGQMWCVICHG